jgi:hypothetical protein
MVCTGKLPHVENEKAVYNVFVEISFRELSNAMTFNSVVWNYKACLQTIRKHLRLADVEGHGESYTE